MPIETLSNLVLLLNSASLYVIYIVLIFQKEPKRTIKTRFLLGVIPRTNRNKIIMFIIHAISKRLQIDLKQT